MTDCNRGQRSATERARGKPDLAQDIDLAESHEAPAERGSLLGNANRATICAALAIFLLAPWAGHNALANEVEEVRSTAPRDNSDPNPGNNPGTGTPGGDPSNTEDVGDNMNYAPCDEDGDQSSGEGGGGQRCSPPEEEEESDEESQEEEPPAEEEEPAEDSSQESAYSQEQDCVDGGGIWRGRHCDSAMDRIQGEQPCSCYDKDGWVYVGDRTYSDCMRYGKWRRRFYSSTVCVSGDVISD